MLRRRWRQVVWGSTAALMVGSVAGCGARSSAVRATDRGVSGSAHVKQVDQGGATKPAGHVSRYPHSARQRDLKPSQRPQGARSTPLGAPVLFRLVPTQGPPGSLVTFVGSGFGQRPGRVELIGVSSGAIALTVQQWSPTRVSARVPVATPRGVYSPALLTAAGRSAGPASDAAWPQFIVTGPPPVVTRMTFRAVPPVTVITVLGHSFGRQAGRVVVCEHCQTKTPVDQRARILRWTADAVQAQVSSMPPGTANVYLTTAAGQVIRAGTLTFGSKSSAPGSQS
jgi:hypothetical protein